MSQLDTENLRAELWQTKYKGQTFIVVSLCFPVQRIFGERIFGDWQEPLYEFAFACGHIPATEMIERVRRFVSVLTDNKVHIQNWGFRFAVDTEDVDNKDHLAKIVDTVDTLDLKTKLLEIQNLEQ